ncbi:hypothetical protein LUX33_09765 [Actinomadura madurae]|uniref:hypothetical protein n=1 Tax=Actinomadura madurae TaxID=1993 RepID=UPI0020D24576|nr:hypothetical protein [Actinomadura madurae]MCP9948670.1 hypothetical protein [Actinomadura madurae]
MLAWERDHQHELVAMELAADGHFFGFAGQAKMSGLFDYVFVSADLRAVEEGRDVKGLDHRTDSGPGRRPHPGRTGPAGSARAVRGQAG